jgi:hypothetical protein
MDVTCEYLQISANPEEVCSYGTEIITVNSLI